MKNVLLTEVESSKICQSYIDKTINLRYYTYMDTSLLRKAGLTESQASGYLALVEHGPLSPTEIAERTNESRTNGYAVADKLVRLGLAVKIDTKRAAYRAAHPSAVAALAERRRKAVVQNEQAVQSGLDGLISYFYEHSEQPGTRTLEGVDGIKKVYDDTLKSQQSIYLLRTTADIPFLGEDYLDTYRKKRAEKGIHTFALTPHSPEGQQNVDRGEDERMLFHRTWLPQGSYTAPVEIDVYDNTVALIAFGGTQMATIIESAFIAEAMRQILTLLAQQLNPTAAMSAEK